MYSAWLSLYLPQRQRPRNRFSSPNPLHTPILSLAFAMVLPDARCILSGHVSKYAAAIMQWSIVFPLRIAPSATHIRAFMPVLMYRLCLSLKGCHGIVATRLMADAPSAFQQAV